MQTATRRQLGTAYSESAEERVAASQGLPSFSLAFTFHHHHLRLALAHVMRIVMLSVFEVFSPYYCCAAMREGPKPHLALPCTADSAS